MWVKLDDQFAHHPKILAAGLSPSTLFVASLCYANRYRTNGFIPDAMLRGLSPLIRYPKPCAAKLVAVGLWHRVASGYAIHDYAAYQPSAPRAHRENTSSAPGAHRERTSSARRAKSPVAVTRTYDSANTPAQNVRSRSRSRSTCTRPGGTAAAGTVLQRVRTAPRPKSAAPPAAPTAAAATAHPPSPKNFPVFRGHRLVLFEWALQDACLTLGREQYESFGIDAFLTQCDAKLEAMRVVLPVKDQARWFLAELAQEAQRRGSELVTAASLHEKTPYDTMNDRCREDQEFLPIGHIVIPQTGGSDA